MNCLECRQHRRLHRVPWTLPGAMATSQVQIISTTLVKGKNYYFNIPNCPYYFNYPTDLNVSYDLMVLSGLTTQENFEGNYMDKITHYHGSTNISGVWQVQGSTEKNSMMLINGTGVPQALESHDLVEELLVVESSQYGELKCVFSRVIVTCDEILLLKRDVNAAIIDPCLTKYLHRLPTE